MARSPTGSGLASITCTGPGPWGAASIARWWGWRDGEALREPGEEEVLSWCDLRFFFCLFSEMERTI